MVEEVEACFNDVPVLPFCYPILLWSVRIKNAMNNTLSDKVAMKTLKLSPPIRLEGENLGAELSFNMGLKFYIHLQDIIFSN